MKLTCLPNACNSVILEIIDQNAVLADDVYNNISHVNIKNRQYVNLQEWLHG